MSLECSECERDLRGGHDLNCSRHPITKTKVALDHFEEMVREHAWIGAQDPLDHPQIETRYKNAKKRLIQLIEKLYRDDD